MLTILTQRPRVQRLEMIFLTEGAKIGLVHENNLPKEKAS